MATKEHKERKDEPFKHSLLSALMRRARYGILMP